MTSVTKIFSLGQGGSESTGSIFNLVYQMRLSDLSQGSAGGLLTSDLSYFVQMKQYLSMFDHVLPSERTLRFNRLNGKLFIDMNWTENLTPGDVILAEVFVLTDPEVSTAMYDDWQLKRLATSYIKRQWAQNLKKYKNLQLPGGVVFDADVLYQEAVDEIEKLEQQMVEYWSGPFGVFVG